MSRTPQLLRHPGKPRRLCVGVFALLMAGTMAMPSSLAQTGARRPSSPETAAAAAKPSVFAQRAIQAFGFLSPMILPTLPARLWPNKGYLTGGPRRITYVYDTTPPPPAPSVARSLEQFYHYPRHLVEGRLALVQEAQRYTHYRLTFPTLLRNRFSAGNQVSAEYYEPTGHATFPVVIVLPHLAGEASLEQFLCRGLASNGIGALAVFPPYYRTELGSLNWLHSSKNPTDLLEIVQLMRESVTSVRQAVDWLQEQPRVQHASFGIIGISLGGIVAALAAGVDDRLQICEYLLAGGDISRLIWSSHLAEAVKQTAKVNGFDREDIGRWWMLIDPLSVAPQARNKQTLMINALFDLTVPRSCTLELWRALGQPPMVWLPAEHATAMLMAPYLRWRTVKYFQQAFPAFLRSSSTSAPTR